MVSIFVHFKCPTSIPPKALCEGGEGRLTTSGHVTCVDCRVRMRELGIDCDPDTECRKRQILMAQIAYVARRADHLHEAIVDLNAQDTNMSLDEVTDAARKIRALTAEILRVIEGTARSSDNRLNAH
jgi:hypothetical protein